MNTLDTKKILIINQFAGSPESGWGERHYYLSKEWIKKGFETWIVSSSYNHMFNSFPEISGQFTLEDFSGTKFCWVKTPKYNPRSFMRFWSMIVFTIKTFFLPLKSIGTPDVIVVSSMSIFPILPGYCLKLRTGAKLIFEIRDLWPLTPIQLMGYSPLHPFMWIIGLFEKLGYRKADHIVSLLPNAAKYIDKISKAPWIRTQYFKAS